MPDSKIKIDSIQNPSTDHISPPASQHTPQQQSQHHSRDLAFASESPLHSNVTNTAAMVPDTPINPKLAASIALTFITMLIFMPMYYTIDDQRLLLSRIEHTRESSGFNLRRLRFQREHRNMTEALLDPTQTRNVTLADNSTRLLRPAFGEMNKVHLRKQNPKLKEERKLKAAKKASAEGQQ